MNALLQASQSIVGAGLSVASAQTALAMKPKFIAGIESEAWHAPGIIDYGSSYSPANNRARQISAQDVGGISNPFAVFRVPIGDAAYRGGAVTAPATGTVEHMADPDLLNVHPAFDPLVGVESMIDPALKGRDERMWADGWEQWLSVALGGAGVLIAVWIARPFFRDLTDAIHNIRVILRKRGAHDIVDHVRQTRQGIESDGRAEVSKDDDGGSEGNA